jgi:hypothetical protein
MFFKKSRDLIEKKSFDDVANGKKVFEMPF